MTAEEIKKDAELEGKKLDDEKTEEAAGGYLIGNPDKYTAQEYNRAGVTWVSHTWEKDEYFVYGVKITQEQAEKITDKALALNPVRPLTKDELVLLFGIHT